MKTIPAKSIVQKTNMEGWFGCDYNMNLYKGCCHGCIYCDSRSSCYGMIRFDEVCKKENALGLIEENLRSKRKKGVVATGSMSDPYNPFEEKEELTKGALKLLDTYGFGVAVATKGDLIVRDIDIFREIKKHSPVICKMTITAAQDEISRKIEPNAPLSSKRFSAVRQLSESGIFCGILLMPILPFLTDSEENILRIVKLAAENGAKFIYPTFGVTMRNGQREWFLSCLEKFFSREQREKFERYYGDRYYCASPNAKRLSYLFRRECERSGILYRMDDIIRTYRKGYGEEQLSFLK